MNYKIVLCFIFIFLTVSGCNAFKSNSQIANDFLSESNLPGADQVEAVIVGDHEKGLILELRGDLESRQQADNLLNAIKNILKSKNTTVVSKFNVVPEVAIFSTDDLKDELQKEITKLGENENFRVSENGGKKYEYLSFGEVKSFFLPEEVVVSGSLYKSNKKTIDYLINRYCIRNECPYIRNETVIVSKPPYMKASRQKSYNLRVPMNYCTTCDQGYTLISLENKGEGNLLLILKQRDRKGWYYSGRKINCEKRTQSYNSATDSVISVWKDVYANRRVVNWSTANAAVKDIIRFGCKKAGFNL